MKNRILRAAILLLLFCAIFVAILYKNGRLIPNNIQAGQYEVLGVDVSWYQGKIDWKQLASQNISFAFIKATEGSAHKDKYFEENFKNALEADLQVGAYHFFSYESSGAAQAQNFIDTVPLTGNILPPVVDIEFYGDNYFKTPDKENAQRELGVLLNTLSEHYGKKPIIYAPHRSYKLYVQEQFSNYPLWIRSVYTKPQKSAEHWEFWQYTDKGRLLGYNGDEPFIDLNVFRGTREEFEKYERG